MSRTEQRIGAGGEQAAALALRARGYTVWRIATPVRIIATRRMERQTWHRLVWSDPVPGDFMGYDQDGRAVLAEVKTVEHNLRWSDFRPHQPPALDAWGGIALVVWVHTSGVYVMRWRDMRSAGFGPGRSITPEQAQNLV